NVGGLETAAPWGLQKGYTEQHSMYIWRKSVGARWLRAHNEDIMRRFGNSFVVIDRPGAQRALLQISFGTRREAQKLIREFGGRAEKLRPDWFQDFAKQTQAKPLRIGSRLLVLRSKAQPSTTTRTIIIPAEAAFGTGEHATTAMCLRLLEQITRPLAPDWTMLDAGTGSGILAIAGSCFGAKHVTAIDTDPLALATAKRNARANRIQNIEFVLADVLKSNVRGKFDVITANLLSEILITALPNWSRQLARHGSLILSGILRSQEKPVVAALRRTGFHDSEVRRRGKWVALLALRQPSKRP
ncbi:MAG: ribosomal protein methyltransferase, partial [Verrucomicrobiota bacterium]